MKEMKMKNLRGKKAIVTGGAMGFGLATCKRLVREGCDVTIWELNESAMLEAKKELDDMGGGKTFVYLCDVSDKERVFELAEQAKKDMGQVDILINNAGFFRPGKFCEIPLEHTVRQMEVNVLAPFYSTYALLPDMLARDCGHVVNVASGASWYGGPGWVGYCTSKAAVHAFSDILKIEIKGSGKKGVNVTSVHPGLALKGMFEGLTFSRSMKLLWPPMEDHDLVAEGIVEDGLKKGKSVVCRPKSIYLMWVFRGLVPNSLWDWLVLRMGAADLLKGYKGRPGMVHTDPDAGGKGTS
jgi:all-trans-retinol dehydrogenase (NAD+)